MIAATVPIQRPDAARLLVIGPNGMIIDGQRRAWHRFLDRGDLIVANDAATLPASLRGIHLPGGAAIEVRLAGRQSLRPDDVREFSSVVFGSGDFRTPTEQRPLPPPLMPGDPLALGPLRATVLAVLDHPRFISLRFDGSPDEIWSGIARHGRPIQYAHMPIPLELWDVWTAIAGPPVAFEPPSAGFVLDWATLGELQQRGIEFATITHAAGISSTGDAQLDARLPFDEPYEIPPRTAQAIQRARAAGRRVVAIGTTVVRAIEYAASIDGIIRAGPGLATGRIGPHTPLRIVDAILTGAHEPSTSHHQLLRAFADDDVLQQADALMDCRGYRTHEFGDSVLIVRQPSRTWPASMGRMDTGLRAFSPDGPFPPEPLRHKALNQEGHKAHKEECSSLWSL